MSLVIDKQTRDFIEQLNKNKEDIKRLQDDINRLSSKSVSVVTTGSSGAAESPASHRDLADVLGLGQIHYNGDVLPLNTTPATFTSKPGDVWYNADDDTVNIHTNSGQIIQIGQEMGPQVVNKTGAQLDDGTVVYISGADVPTDKPTVVKADATTWEDSQMTIGVTTADIADDGTGPVTTDGLVRGIDTSGMTAGDRIYLSEIAGEFTIVKPTSPAYIINLGVVVKVDASDGIILVHVANTDDFGFFNGTFMESFDLTVASDGATITASLQRTGGGNLTTRFGSDFATLVTPPMTKILTAGSATVPKANYLYILESDQTQITLSTSSYPTNVDHIKIAKVVVFTAAITQNDDALANQNVNDHAVDNILMGHLAHLGEWIRAQPATWVSGVAGNSATGDDYLDITAGPDAVHFVSTGGTIRQLHLQAYAARDNTDWIYVINDPDAAYTRVTELIAGIDKLSTGVAIGNNKYFALVFWGIQNKSGEISQLICNLPSGQYNSQTGAENDISGFTNVDIPDEFRSTGFLICKLVIQLSGATWIYKSTLDLRGTNPSIVTGAGGGAAIVDFPDNTHNIFNAADPTKRILHDASAIATGTDRTITMPDNDLTLIDRDEAVVQYAPVIPVFMFNGTTQSTKNRFPYINFPAADNNAGALWQFHIPPTWSADKMNIKIRFSIPSTTDGYSVLFNAGAAGDGSDIAAFQDNLINNDSTNDFVQTGTSDEVQTKTLAVDDVNLDVGNFVVVAIASDASNTPLLRIYEVWLEPDYT